MKKFCLYYTVFCITAFFLSAYIVPLSLRKNYRETIPGAEIYRSIDKSKKRIKKKKLIIGDSTANQFFDNREDNDSICSLACNQAIGMCGHFFLLNNYIKAGNRPEEVYMIYNAYYCFANNLNQVYTYHYFLKPFYNDEYKPLMTPEIFSQVRKIPYHTLCQIPAVLTSSWAPAYPTEESDYTFMSPISREYLRKIDSLSCQYNFRLYIVPSFMDEKERQRVASFDANEFKDEPYADKMTIFLNQISYMNSSRFSDGLHLTPSMVKRYKPLLEEKMEDVKNEYIHHHIYKE